jgi:hypothetical protein
LRVGFELAARLNQKSATFSFRIGFVWAEFTGVAGFR